jgi:hypothetical protein
LDWLAAYVLSHNDHIIEVHWHLPESVSL